MPGREWALRGPSRTLAKPEAAWVIPPPRQRMGGVKQRAVITFGLRKSESRMLTYSKAILSQNYFLGKPVSRGLILMLLVAWRMKCLFSLP